jgi:hypothetical protein
LETIERATVLIQNTRMKRPTRILPTPVAIRPATDPANAGVRDAFCLNTFPPSNGHGSGPQPRPRRRQKHKQQRHKTSPIQTPAASFAMAERPLF